MCLVGFGLLNSVDKDSAAPFVPRKQVASLHAGWTEIPRRFVDGLVSYNETRCTCIEMQTESSVLVAQSVGCNVWLGGSCGSKRQLTSRARRNQVAKCQMVGIHEKWLELALVTTAGDIEGETGSAVLSMACPRSSV